MDPYQLIITAEAESDIMHAYTWYETFREGLGDELQEQIEGAMETLQVAPFRYAPYRFRYRKMILNKFPYSVIFEVSEEHRTVTVLRILHQSRKPF